MKKLPTPCHIMDLDALSENLIRISELKKLSGCSIYLAVKGFSSPYFFNILKNTLDGISASGLYEAKLGYEKFRKKVQTYSPAFCDDQIYDVVKYSNTVVFNSQTQLDRYYGIAKAAGCSCGIRINPLFSEIAKKDANPCREHSHLGIPVGLFSREILDYIDGIHVHAMCEHDADVLERLVEQLIDLFGDDLSKLKWINLGGGQLIGHRNYDIERAAKCINKLKDVYNVQVIIEPCEGIFTECGYFATRVLDIIENDGKVVILDASPVCHMQDAVFRGWSREIESESEHGYTYLLCGQTCFAGDRFGWYTFKKPLQINDILIFKDTATYTRVKNNAFNGIPFPYVCTYSKSKGYTIVKEYGYNDFYNIL